MPGPCRRDLLPHLSVRSSIVLDPFPMWWLWSSFFIEFFSFFAAEGKKIRIVGRYPGAAGRGAGSSSPENNLSKLNA